VVGYCSAGMSRFCTRYFIVRIHRGLPIVRRRLVPVLQHVVNLRILKFKSVVGVLELFKRGSGTPYIAVRTPLDRPALCVCLRVNFYTGPCEVGDADAGMEIPPNAYGDKPAAEGSIVQYGAYFTVAPSISRVSMTTTYMFCCQDSGESENKQPLFGMNSTWIILITTACSRNRLQIAGPRLYRLVLVSDWRNGRHCPRARMPCPSFLVNSWATICTVLRQM
jgi:hypothetical protein